MKQIWSHINDNGTISVISMFIFFLQLNSILDRSSNNNNAGRSAFSGWLQSIATFRPWAIGNDIIK